MPSKKVRDASMEPQPTEVTVAEMPPVVQNALGWSDFRIETAEHLKEAVDALQEVIGPAIDRVMEFFGPLKKKAFLAHREITSKEKEFLKPLQTIQGRLKTEIRLWKTRNRDEASKLSYEARMEEAAQRQSHAIQVMLDSGDDAGAERIASQPVEDFLEVVPAVIDDDPNVHLRKTFRAEVTGMELFLRWVLEDVENRSVYVEGNRATLTDLARRQRDAFDVPGVSLVADEAVVLKRTYSVGRRKGVA